MFNFFEVVCLSRAAGGSDGRRIVWRKALCRRMYWFNWSVSVAEGQAGPNESCDRLKNICVHGEGFEQTWFQRKLEASSAPVFGSHSALTLDVGVSFELSVYFYAKPGLASRRGRDATRHQPWSTKKTDGKFEDMTVSSDAMKSALIII